MNQWKSYQEKKNLTNYGNCAIVSEVSVEEEEEWPLCVLQAFLLD